MEQVGERDEAEQPVIGIHDRQASDARCGHAVRHHAQGFAGRCHDHPAAREGSERRIRVGLAAVASKLLEVCPREAGEQPAIRVDHGIEALAGIAMVRVDGAAMRSQKTIDDLCLGLQPLGDTLAVVVHLQNAAAATRDQMDTLSRNCQLAPGDTSTFVHARTVDALDPAVRAQHRATVERVQRAPPGEQVAGDKAAVEAMAEM